jgi:hypothetical protein
MPDRKPEDKKTEPEDKKPEYVDLIQEATRQNWRFPERRVVVEPAIKDKRRLSHWPPSHLEEWRANNLAPWKSRSRKLRDWD